MQCKLRYWQRHCVDLQITVRPEICRRLCFKYGNIFRVLKRNYFNTFEIWTIQPRNAVSVFRVNTVYLAFFRQHLLHTWKKIVSVVLVVVGSVPIRTTVFVRH